MQNNEIVYVDINSFSPYINFALEYYLIFEKKLPYKSVFLFWQTEPTLMLGKYQNVYEEINLDYVKEHNMEMVSDTGAIKSVIEEIVANNEKAVQEYKDGKEKSFNFLVGQSMRALKGKAPSTEVTRILKELLG